MIRLIRGEFYRLLHKKSTYLYFALLAVGYFLVAFVRSGGFTAQSVVDDALNAFVFLPVLVGGFLFAAVYTDDLNARNLAVLVGFGISKTKVVLAKLVCAAVLNAAAFALVPLFHVAVYALFGSAATTDALGSVYAVAFKFYLTTVAFSALSGIVVYGLQRTTFAVVAFVLLAFNVVSGLAASLFGLIDPALRDHLIPGITDRIVSGVVFGSPVAGALVEYIAYVAFAVAVSAVVFHRKEMEF
ncbi:MAG: hypothetical protein FWG23_05685 [Eggerthellaceae bacterium]|nr:hypothetical protein [Eggerthellaceae bacterium]